MLPFTPTATVRDVGSASAGTSGRVSAKQNAIVGKRKDVTRRLDHVGWPADRPLRRIERACNLARAAGFSLHAIFGNGAALQPTLADGRARDVVRRAGGGLRRRLPRLDGPCAAATD